jgi:phosphoglycerate dehydrogenase-like enzyme
MNHNSVDVLIAGQQSNIHAQYLKNELSEHEIVTSNCADLFKYIEDARVIIPTQVSLDDYLISKARNLLLIQMWGVGFDNVDIQSAFNHRIPVANIPSEMGNAISVAEWCIMAAMYLSRNSRRIESPISAEFHWGEPIGTNLNGHVAGIIGYGGVGKQLAKRLSALGMKVIATCIHPENKDDYSELVWLGNEDDLYKLLKQADYVFLCLPLNKKTHNLIGLNELYSLHKGAFLINAARGSIIQCVALSKVIQDKHLGGIALDVFWPEHLTDQNIFNLINTKHNNILFTPHIAGATKQSFELIAKIAALNIRRIFSGYTPNNIVNETVRTI